MDRVRIVGKNATGSDPVEPISNDSSEAKLVGKAAPPLRYAS